MYKLHPPYCACDAVKLCLRKYESSRLEGPNLVANRYCAVYRLYTMEVRKYESTSEVLSYFRKYISVRRQQTSRLFVKKYPYVQSTIAVPDVHIFMYTSRARCLVVLYYKQATYFYFIIALINYSSKHVHVHVQALVVLPEVFPEINSDRDRLRVKSYSMYSRIMRRYFRKYVRRFYSIQIDIVHVAAPRQPYSTCPIFIVYLRRSFEG